MKTGDKIILQMSHLLETVRFSAKVVKVNTNGVIVLIPERIRKLQWTEFPNKYYRFPLTAAKAALAK